jgi:sortase A
MPNTTPTARAPQGPALAEQAPEGPALAEQAPEGPEQPGQVIAPLAPPASQASAPVDRGSKLPAPAVPVPAVPAPAVPVPAVPAAAIATAPATRPAAKPREQPVLQAVGVGLSLLGVFLLGFLAYLYGISGIEEARAQTTLYPTLQVELGNQVAPLGATTPGNPVAIMNIPSIGIHHMIVVEGTSPENLMLGPGHVRDTPLPGQYGVSEIFGRRATFGAPFARLSQLRRGDKISVITGQGTSSYTVVASGSSRLLIEDPAPNRLLLFTSCSAYVPTSYCYYDADLTSSPQPEPGGLPPITLAETPLSGDSSALVLTMMWGLALLIVSAAGTVAAVRWSPWLAYLAAAPLVLAVLWNLYQSLAALLPNLY